MNPRAGKLIRFYRTLLKLYPPSFREAYSEEMLIVFQMQLVGIASLNRRLSFLIMWRELQPLPGLLVAAHLRERKLKMRTGLERWFVQPEGSNGELLLISLPFLMFAMPGVFSLIPALLDIPAAIGIAIISLMALTLIALGIIGLIFRLPRWSLVYAGAFLTLVTMGGLAVFANLTTVGNSLNWGAYATTSIFFGLQLIIIFMLVAFIRWISGKISIGKAFHQQITADPSLISLMLYGGTLIVMIANFEDVSGVDWYLIGSSAALLFGAWGYLHYEKLTSRLLSLITGNTIATGMALAANLFLVNYNSPPVLIGNFQIERVVLFIGLTWLTSLGMILLPVIVFREKGTAVST